MKNKIKEIQEKIEEKPIVKNIIVGIIILGLSGIIMGLTFALSSATVDMDLFNSYLKSPLLMFMNFLPIVLVMVILYAATNRLWAGYSITAALFIILGIVNKIKLTYRDDPFIFADVRLGKESLEMAGRYDIGIGPKWIMAIIGLALIGVILKIFFDFRIKSKKVRLGFVLFILSGAFLFNGFYFDQEVYAKVGDETLINKWIDSQQFQSKGFVYPFIYSAKDLKEEVPENYDERKAEKILSEYTYENIEENKKVNLITVMLEAYNDFSKFDTIEVDEEIYKYLHELQEESISGKLVTNVFAGGTIDTERGLLTGYHHHPKYKRKTNSHVWYMREQGYKTEAMHPITGSFYDRRNGNEYIGFHNFDYYENKYEEIQKEYLMDMKFFDYVIEGYEESIEEGKPYFNYTLTYQNHGPYSDEKRTDKEYLKRRPEYTDADYNIANNYLAGISETTQAIKKLIDYFEGEEEPVVLVFFGDHNPWLGKDNSGYDMLNIDIDLGEEKGFRNYYETPYIIWANGAAKEVTENDFIGQGPDLSPNQLMTETFEQIGWKGNEYMQFLSDLKEEMPVNHLMYFQEKGELVPSAEVSDGLKEKWKNFVDVEHYMQTNFIER